MVIKEFHASRAPTSNQTDQEEWGPTDEDMFNMKGFRRSNVALGAAMARRRPNAAGHTFHRRENTKQLRLVASGWYAPVVVAAIHGTVTPVRSLAAALAHMRFSHGSEVWQARMVAIVRGHAVTTLAARGGVGDEDRHNLKNWPRSTVASS
ncbi:hypothetical protein NM688_g4177 [Phlebia brevispora]|uniref:Uncharacterized protein n=1 Tax=Phlebia brevispora TaxID=194682 RepID=A0ACC1T495_9APHY|nr:hypothetical protein NM688_g4177 [Phlebia brevispora]